MSKLSAMSVSWVFDCRRGLTKFPWALRLNFQLCEQLSGVFRELSLLRDQAALTSHCRPRLTLWGKCQLRVTTIRTGKHARMRRRRRERTEWRSTETIVLN